MKHHSKSRTRSTSLIWLAVAIFISSQCAFANPQVSLSSTTLDFGGAGVAGQFGGNQFVTINNPGNAPLIIQSMAFTGATSGEFLVTPPPCTSVGVQSNCAFNIEFMPLSAGSKSATLVITDNAPDSPQTIQLSGTAAPAPQLQITPASFDFGTHDVGIQSAAQTFTLTNTGGGIIHLFPDFIADGSKAEDFSIAGTSCYQNSFAISAGNSCTVSVTFTPQATGARTGYWEVTTTGTGSGIETDIPVSGMGGSLGGLRFVPVTPCRLVDTRGAAGSFGGPVVASQTSRDFAIPNGNCSIPMSAAAYSLNVTVVPSGHLGWLTLWPTGESQPLVSTLNSVDGRIKANAAIVPAGSNGAVSVFVTEETHVVIDIDGYFVSANDPAGLAFYPLTPCRVMDTRGAAGTLAGPLLAGGQERELPISASPCQIPSSATAYSMNLTVVPKVPLNYLTVWPSGQTRPLVSTLNAPIGTATANAAIVPAGQGGDISVFTTDDTDLIIDVNGYFAPPGAGGLSLYTLQPCRLFDSRTQLPAPIEGLETVSINACGLPVTAQAAVLNATIVPSAATPFLTLWPASQLQPTVSTLNAYDSITTSNMAIVPTSNRAVSSFTAGPSHLILDISSYFAP